MPANPRKTPAIPPPDLATLLPSWELALRSERKSPSTIQQYTIGARLFIRWCTANHHTPAMDRTLVKGFIAGLLDDGIAPSTAILRQQSLRQFSRWLTEEGELEANPLLGLRPPKADVKVVQSLDDDQLRELIKACAGQAFRDRRDEAVVRLLAETGMRCGELLALTLDDIDLEHGRVMVHRAKNHHGRFAPFGPQTARAIDRYLRVRKGHRLASGKVVWLGDGGRNISYHGLRGAILRRAELAGLKRFHLHQLRHTAASRWLRAGGSEGGAMAVMGWRNRNMLDRYVASTANERAADEARGLALGDL
jgi:site-specific recombinase XerD